MVTLHGLSRHQSMLSFVASKFKTGKKKNALRPTEENKLKMMFLLSGKVDV